MSGGVYPSARRGRHLGLCQGYQYELPSLTDKAWAEQGAVSFLVSAHTDPTWQAAKGMWVLLSLMLVKSHWANSLTA